MHPFDWTFVHCQSDTQTQKQTNRQTIRSKNLTPPQNRGDVTKELVDNRSQLCGVISLVAEPSVISLDNVA